MYLCDLAHSQPLAILDASTGHRKPTDQEHREQLTRPHGNG